MDIFGRYIFRMNASALLLILMSLTGILWIAMALKQLKLLTSAGQSSVIFLKMTFLALPSLLAVILPIALLIATIHTLNRLNGDSELIVYNAAGAHAWKIIRPVVLLALVICAAIALANAVVIPWSQQTLRSYVTKVRTDLISQVLQPGKFSSPEKGLTFHIRDRDRSGELQGLVMSDARDPRQHLTYLAKRGNIQRQDKATLLVMTEGHIIYRDPKVDGARIVTFEKYVIDLSRFGPKTTSRRLKPGALYLSELWSPDKNLWAYKKFQGKMRSELHERLANPLYPLVFVLIAIAFLGQAQTTRQNRVRSVITAFGLAAGIRVLGLAATNFASNHASAVLLIYAIPLSAIVLALAVTHYRMSPRRRSRFARNVDTAIENTFTRVRRAATGSIGTGNNVENRP